MTFEKDLESESQTVEYKESWRDEYLKWLCGFANAKGGVLYIGVRDDGTVCGVVNSKKLMELLPNLIRDTLGIIADVDLLHDGEKDYIRITVGENPYPVSYKGEYHYRSGSTKQELKGNALTRFLLKKTGMSWDSGVIGNLAVKDFRNDSFDIFRTQAVASGRMTAKDTDVSNEMLAQKLDLLVDGEITRAGVLLFYHNPERLITGAWIKIGYFANDADIVYQDEIHGSLLQQTDTVIDLIYTKYLTAPITYKGITRVETYPYPREAVREAVLNAVVHKKYGSFTPIQIRVYADKLRIVNDSILPDGVTPDQLINEGKSRPANPRIANTFYRAGYIESWGRGIQEIRTVCKEHGNPAPEFRVDADAVFVTFYPLKTAGTLQTPRRLTPQVDPAGTPQADRINNILTFCSIPRKRDEIQAFLNLKDREYFRKEILIPLVERGLLRLTEPDKPTSPNQRYYAVPESYKQ
jgi:ATP-dependent DNA helicase RecG